MRKVISEKTSRMYFGDIQDVVEMPNLMIGLSKKG